MKKTFALFISIMLIFNGFTQSTEQLLQIIHKKNISDTTKASAYLTLSQKVAKTNLDSAITLLQLAEKHITKALQKIRKAGYKQRLTAQLAQTYYLRAKFEQMRGNYGIALNYYKKALKIYSQLGNTALQAQTETDIALIYKKFNDTSMAIKYLNLGLKHAKPNSKQYANLLDQLAELYSNSGMLDKATTLLSKSYDIYKKLDSQKAANTLIQLAKLANLQGDTTAAKQLLSKSLEINIKLNDKQQIFQILLTIGQIYLNQEQLDSALNYFILAYDVANSLNPLAQAKAQYFIAKIYTLNKKLKRAEEIAQKAFMFAKFEHDTLLMIQLAELLKEINLQQGNCPLALKYLSTKNKLQTQYLQNAAKAQQRKLQTIAKLQQQAIVDSLYQQLNSEKFQRLQEQNKFKQALWLGMLFIAALLLFIILLTIKQKRTIQNLQLDLQTNPKVRDLIQKITSEQEQLRQNQQYIKNLLLQLEIDYNNAQTLVKAILPDEKLLKQKFQDCFKIYIPKRQISGDFYWWTEKNNQIFIAVADTTGQGISGALITMMAIHLLNQAVDKFNDPQPNQILEFVRTELNKQLEQHLQLHYDRINISLIRLDQQKQILTYAGARQSIYIIAQQNLQLDQQLSKKIKIHKHNNITLVELKPDLFSLSAFSRNKPFESIQLQIPPLTQIYLFTDGFANQFGGEFDEKFGRRKFRQLIMENAHKPMAEQKQILIKTFKQWKGEHEQTDDITIIGIKTKNPEQ